MASADRSCCQAAPLLEDSEHVASTSMSQPQQAGLKIFSLNAALWPWDCSRQTSARVEQLAAAAAHYDIVVLQEAFEMQWWCGCIDNRWTDQLRSLLPRHHVAVAPDDGCCCLLNSGLMVASKLPVASQRAIPLSSGGLWYFPCCCVKKHVAQEVVLDVGEGVGRVAVFNNHLVPDEATDWPCPFSWVGAEEVRFQQLDDLQRTLPTSHWLVLGDLNFDATEHGERAVRALEGQGMTRTDSGSFNVTLPWAKHPDHTMTWVTDFLIWGDGVSLVEPAKLLDEAPHNQLSDHYGYEAEVALHPIPNGAATGGALSTGPGVVEPRRRANNSTRGGAGP